MGAAFQEGKAYVPSNANVTGHDLFHAITELAAVRGWTYGNEHAGYEELLTLSRHES